MRHHHSHRLLAATAASALLSMSAEADNVDVGAGAQPTTEPLDEYGSFTLQLNHLVTQNDDQTKTVLSVIHSTEAADEALLSQLRYFADLELLTSQRLREELSVAEEKDVVIIYETPRGGLTNIIVDARVFTETFAKPPMGGTVLNTHASLLALGTDLIRAEKARCLEAAKRGEHTHPSRVLFFVLNDPT